MCSPHHQRGQPTAPLPHRNMLTLPNKGANSPALWHQSAATRGACGFDNLPICGSLNLCVCAEASSATIAVTTVHTHSLPLRCVAPHLPKQHLVCQHIGCCRGQLQYKHSSIADTPSVNAWGWLQCYACTGMPLIALPLPLLPSH